MPKVFDLLQRVDAALGVQSASGVVAFAFISCSAGGSAGTSLKLEGGADPTTVLEAYKAQADGDASVELRVSENASYGDLIGALDALLGAGVEGVWVQLARVGATGRIVDIPSVRIGQPTAQGDLDKAIIRRYLKRNIAKITSCYEKELAQKPGMQGTISTQFFIGPDGIVKKSQASGFDQTVADCVAAVIQGIEFPKPKGGGGVQVDYPFTFRPSGG
jgi:hypothetical protein